MANCDYEYSGCISLPRGHIEDSRDFSSLDLGCIALQIERLLVEMLAVR